MPLANNYRHHKSNVIPLFSDDHGGHEAHFPVDIDSALYSILQEKATREQTTEQDIILQAILYQLRNKRIASAHPPLHKNTLTVIENPDYKGTARK